MKPILLHICCAPCGGGCVERLREEDREPVLFYSNSNIDTREEFARRLDSVRRLAEIDGLELVVDDYQPQEYLADVAGLENEPEKGRRCMKCFARSFRRTAGFAAERGLNWTSTLTVSPHKVSRMIFEAAAFSPAFEAWDFKKRNGFLRSREIAQKYGFYLQNYCGCRFSRRAELKNIASSP